MSHYKGRFAPSPTGDVHFGTLLAATASYLQAKSRQGSWLLRIDDIDTPRTVKGADLNLIKTLERYGFEWQGEIYYQSQHLPDYASALKQLIEQQQVFPCLCSRKQLTGNNIYPGNCRHRHLPEPADHALRLRGNDTVIQFKDKVMGAQQQNIAKDCGDFIIKRRDGLFAYQLAVVVDDALQGITEVVRGSDLLSSTARQIYLQQRLHYQTPEYLHIPVAVDAHAHKYSKSSHAASLDGLPPETQLVRCLQFLGQKTEQDLEQGNIRQIWQWAKQHWDTANIPAVMSIAVK